MPGHALIGYITKYAGLTVHRADCKSFAKSNRDAARVIEASWEGEGLYETHFRVTIGQRPNVLSDLTNALRPILKIARFMPTPYMPMVSASESRSSSGSRPILKA